MFGWLKDNTVGRFRRWKSRLFLRYIGELNKERFHERAKNIPEELREYHGLEIIMNSNSSALHNLYRKAKDSKKFQEAFLYFFYEFEINLKHMIMSEMMMIDSLKALEKGGSELFPVYSKAEINEIKKIGKISKLIELFCSVHGKEIENDLTGINQARNFIIHNMLKEEMSEEQIKKSFEYFFTASNSAISNTYGFFNKTLEERPGKTLEKIQKMAGSAAIGK